MKELLISAVFPKDIKNKSRVVVKLDDNEGIFIGTIQNTKVDIVVLLDNGDKWKFPKGSRKYFVGLGVDKVKKSTIPEKDLNKWLASEEKPIKKAEKIVEDIKPTTKPKKPVVEEKLKPKVKEPKEEESNEKETAKSLQVKLNSIFKTVDNTFKVTANLGSRLNHFNYNCKGELGKINFTFTLAVTQNNNMYQVNFYNIEGNKGKKAFDVEKTVVLNSKYLKDAMKKGINDIKLLVKSAK
jgi:hypothetical protein